MSGLVKFPTGAGESAATRSGDVITLAGTALTNGRTFANALADTDIDFDDGDDCNIYIIDGTDYEEWRATYASGAGTLTKVARTAVQGSIGTAALTVYAMPGGAWLNELEQVRAGFIDFSDNNPISRTDSDTISVVAGAAVVNGSLLSWSSPRTADITSGSDPADAEQLAHIYLYDSSGTPTLELTANTAPVWDATLRCWKKTGDDTRRWIGAWPVYLDGSTYKLAKAYSVWDGLRLSMYYTSTAGATDDFDRNSLWAVTSGSATAPTQITLPYCPVAAHEFYCFGALAAGTDDTDVVIGIDPADWDDSVAFPARDATWSARLSSASNVDSVYFGRSPVPLIVPPSVYYMREGTLGVFVGCYGWTARL